MGRERSAGSAPDQVAQNGGITAASNLIPWAPYRQATAILWRKLKSHAITSGSAISPNVFEISALSSFQTSITACFFPLEGVEHVVDVINGLEPDLVAITGDYVTTRALTSSR